MKTFPRVVIFRSATPYPFCLGEITIKKICHTPLYNHMEDV